MKKCTFFVFLLLFLGSIAQAQIMVYREFRFPGAPSESYFDGLGLKRSHGIYEDEVTGGTPPAEQSLMVSTAQRTAANYALYQNRFWYDIEYLNTDAKYVGNTVAAANARTLAKYIGWAKSAVAGKRAVGLYSKVPCTDLYMKNRLAQRQAWNDLLQPLADALDFICPSIYLYYSEAQVPYASYAGPMVTEAKRLAKGKKVIAFVSPGYHSSGDHDNQWATYSVWKNVLNSIKAAGADGMVIYAGKDKMGTQPSSWSYIDTCGWWRATKEFMQSLGTGSSIVGAPSIVVPTAGAVISSSGFTSRWRRVSGAVKYQVQLSRTSSFATPVFSDSAITDTLRRFTSLTPGVSYWIRVRARGTSSWGSYSSIVQFSTTSSQSSASVISSEITGPAIANSTQLVWSATEGAEAYHLQISDENTFAAPVFDDSTLTDTLRIVTLASTNAQYYARVRAKVESTWDPWSPDHEISMRVVSSTEAESALPTAFALAQNFPNPFNPSTTIRFSLPVGAHVKLTVFNSLGQEVRTLVDDLREAGYHEVRFDGAGMASGVYFYRMQAGSYIQTRKLCLVK